MLENKELFFNRSANRASLCARAAADALVSVDLVHIALRNAGNRASVCASAACNALVGNLVCHGKYLREFYDYLYFSICAIKNQEHLIKK